MTGIGFAVSAEDGCARRGHLETAHGIVQTPAFMPVGTAATVKAMTSEAVAETGAGIVLANTYHLMLRPGPERVRALGGLHRFMNWPSPILTDSGGFQVMSLSALRDVTESGVAFRSHIDGGHFELTPERAIEIQGMLGADVAMALDECIPHPRPKDDVARAMRLTSRWAERSKAAFAASPGRGLFGIVQGGSFNDLRAESADDLVRIGFDGYALGGFAVGEEKTVMLSVLEATAPLLPAGAPRYLMGVGKPEDLVEAVARGIDMFDCVLPTRSGRTGQAFTREGALNLRNAVHADDPRPLDESCACPVCRGYGRAYVNHLVRAGEILGSVLLTWHNLHYYQDLMAEMRGAIEAGGFQAFAIDFAARRTEAGGAKAVRAQGGG
ncbi:MAG: tRNA guanosine(34) transglycosylase Tgt [Rhodospirillales bacterium]|nr:tRNA guanosine(34) transglycosylase Tgt [Rhodospirillales bacterium]MDP6804061.1 tRNA guanosine(34) transglycosylase Tgt [Rhodospirillales bacterium]